MDGIESLNHRMNARASRRVAAALGSVRISFEIGVILFAVGIGTYFAWPTEPDMALVIAVFAVCGIALYVSLATHYEPLAIAVACILAGFVWSTLSTEWHDPNPLDREYRLDLEATVVADDRARSMRRLYLEPLSVSPVPDSGIPERLRVRVGRAFDDIGIGETIRVTVVADALPGPVVPNGYDPARRAYFDGLAGSGFAISQPTRLSAEPTLPVRFKAKLFEIRSGIAERVRASAPEETSGLQAALLTGIRDHILPEQTEALRASGLAHILAISGLHMGMVSFGLFAVLAFGLSLIERYARARDVRKPAAIVALVGATAYLLVSGGSVATQRAFIMVCIAFCAVLLDRRVISVRSVAVAALVTLLIRPEALTSVGFQMSFAAVTAMVVIFRAWQDRRPARKPEGLRDRIASFYGSLFGTSVIAGFATGGFALLHFGRIARYGLLGNMAAMAVFPLVMAFGIMSLLLMPLGLERLPLEGMSLFLTFMLWVANRVAALPGAVDTVKASQPVVIALYGLGFAMACLATRRAVIGGLVLMAAAVILWFQAPTYDMRVTQTGRVSLFTEEGAQTSSLRADRYGRDQFARSDGMPDRDWQNYHDDFADCDAFACRFTLKGRDITITDEPSEVAQSCEDSEIVVLTQRQTGPVARRGCRALLIDQRLLDETGGVHIRFGETTIITPILSPQRARRPWG